MTEEIIKRWKSLGEYCTMLPCPRCGHVSMRKELSDNALSRRVDLYICPNCWIDEALEDYRGRKRPLESWFLFTELFGSEADAIKMTNNEFELDVYRKVIILKEDIDSIVSGALDSGITYWCNKAEVVEDDYYGEYASEQISHGGSLRLYDREEDKTYVLTLNKLLNGIRLACRDGYGDNWFDDDHLDFCQIDAVATNVIVQCALFGEVVYG